MDAFFSTIKKQVDEAIEQVFYTLQRLTVTDHFGQQYRCQKASCFLCSRSTSCFSLTPKEGVRLFFCLYSLCRG
jgi:hypothetical protein